MPVAPSQDTVPTLEQAIATRDEAVAARNEATAVRDGLAAARDAAVAELAATREEAARRQQEAEQRQQEVEAQLQEADARLRDPDAAAQVQPALSPQGCTALSIAMCTKSSFPTALCRHDSCFRALFHAEVMVCAAEATRQLEVAAAANLLHADTYSATVVRSLTRRRRREPRRWRGSGMRRWPKLRRPALRQPPPGPPAPRCSSRVVTHLVSRAGTHMVCSPRALQPICAYGNGICNPLQAAHPLQSTQSQCEDDQHACKARCLCC